MTWKNEYHAEIKSAIDVCKKAQRNYDLNTRLPRKDLEPLIYVATNSPLNKMKHILIYEYIPMLKK